MILLNDFPDFLVVIRVDRCGADRCVGGAFSDFVFDVTYFVWDRPSLDRPSLLFLAIVCRYARIARGYMLACVASQLREWGLCKL